MGRGILAAQLDRGLAGWWGQSPQKAWKHMLTRCRCARRPFGSAGNSLMMRRRQFIRSAVALQQ
jgi:hypothetical protein